MSIPNRKPFLLFVLLTCFIPSCGLIARQPTVPPASEQTILVSGVERSYYLYLPPGLATSKLLPLVFVLHGGGGEGRSMARFTGFDQLVASGEAIVVAPNGYRNGWADGRGASFADQDSVDDVAFFEALIADLVARYPIDSQRIYATGISNGGFMSQRLACDLSRRIAAVASVAASMSQFLSAYCAPERPVPVMMIFGLDDPLVPAEGGQVFAERGEVLSIWDSVARWKEINACPMEAAQVEEFDRVDDGTRVQVELYAPCSGGSQVIFYAITGGGHTWPGSVQYRSKALIGLVSQEIKAWQVIWDFFKQFSSD